MLLIYSSFIQFPESFLNNFPSHLSWSINFRVRKALTLCTSEKNERVDGAVYATLDWLSIKVSLFTEDNAISAHGGDLTRWWFCNRTYTCVRTYRDIWQLPWHVRERITSPVCSVEYSCGWQAINGISENQRRAKARPEMHFGCQTSNVSGQFSSEYTLSFDFIRLSLLLTRNELISYSVWRENLQWSFPPDCNPLHNFTAPKLLPLRVCSSAYQSMS